MPSVGGGATASRKRKVSGAARSPGREPAPARLGDGPRSAGKSSGLVGDSIALASMKFSLTFEFRVTLLLLAEASVLLKVLDCIGGNSICHFPPTARPPTPPSMRVDCEELALPRAASAAG